MHYTNANKRNLSESQRAAETRKCVRYHCTHIAQRRKFYAKTYVFISKSSPSRFDLSYGFYKCFSGFIHSKIDDRKRFNKNTYAYVNLQTDSYKTFDENTFVLIDAIHPSIYSASTRSVKVLVYFFQFFL